MLNGSLQQSRRTLWRDFRHCSCKYMARCSLSLYSSSLQLVAPIRGLPVPLQSSRTMMSVMMPECTLRSHHSWNLPSPKTRRQLVNQTWTRWAHNSTAITQRLSQPRHQPKSNSITFQGLSVQPPNKTFFKS